MTAKIFSADTQTASAIKYDSNYFMCKNSIFDLPVSKNEFPILLYLFSLQNALTIHPSHATIAKKCKISIDTTARALKSLEEKGYVLIKHHASSGKTNHYSISRKCVLHMLSREQGQEVLPLASCGTTSCTLRHNNNKIINTNTHTTSQKPVCVPVEKTKAKGAQTPVVVPPVLVQESVSTPATVKPVLTLNPVNKPEIKTATKSDTNPTPKQPIPTPVSNGQLSTDTLRWLFKQYGHALVMEILAIITFQGSKPVNLIGMVIYMCKNGYATPKGYAPIAKRTAAQDSLHREQSERKRAEAVKDAEEVALEQRYQALPAAERDTLLDMARESVKGQGAYALLPVNLKCIAMGLLRGA